MIKQILNIKSKSLLKQYLTTVVVVYFVIVLYSGIACNPLKDKVALDPDIVNIVYRP